MPNSLNPEPVKIWIEVVIESYILAHRIRIPKVLRWDRKSYLTHAILPRTSSNAIICNCILAYSVDFELKKVQLPPPLGNFADISYLEENIKPHFLRDVCTLCSGALVSDSLLHMLL